MFELIIQLVKSGIFILVLIGFIYVYWTLFKGAWDENNQPSKGHLQGTSILTGSVSGVVATMLGVDPPPENPDDKLAAMGEFVFPIGVGDLNQIIAVLYLVGYMWMVVWATKIWFGPENKHRPQIIDGLAAIGIGVGVAVLAGLIE